MQRCNAGRVKEMWRENNHNKDRCLNKTYSLCFFPLLHVSVPMWTRHQNDGKIKNMYLFFALWICGRSDLFAFACTMLWFTCSDRGSRILTMAIAYGTVSALRGAYSQLWSGIHYSNMEMNVFSITRCRVSVRQPLRNLPSMRNAESDGSVKYISYLSVAASVKIHSFEIQRRRFYIPFDCVRMERFPATRKISILWFQSISMHTLFFLSPACAFKILVCIDRLDRPAVAWLFFGVYYLSLSLYRRCMLHVNMQCSNSRNYFTAVSSGSTDAK